MNDNHINYSNKKKKFVIIVFTLAFIICIATLVIFSRGDKDNYIAHGYVDLKASSLSFERSGKIESIYVTEGQKVNKGTVLSKLDTKELNHELLITSAKCKGLDAKLALYEKGYRDEEILQAKANVKKLTENYELSKISLKRIEELYKSKSISVQERDNALFNNKMTKSQLDEANAKLTLMQTGYRDEEIAQVQAEYDSCKAQIDMLNYKINEQSVIKAPFDGIVRTSFREEADFVSSNQAVFELVKANKKRVAVFVAYEQLPFICTGQKALIIISDNIKVPGVVSFISDTAMFTPKTVQTQDLRADLVYEVRVETDDKNDLLKYGLPVTVQFSNAN